MLAFTVTSSNLETIECSVDNSGDLGNRKGINLSPSPSYSKPFLKRKDHEDLELAKELGVEFVTVSCIRNVSDLKEIKKILYGNENHNPSHQETEQDMISNHFPKLLSKIENKSGLESFEAILAHSDGIIIDRGYLGVEIDLASISTIQKLLVQGCTMKGKPVLIANHILESMRELPRPSRSEASDIASAVFLGGDGYILSSETAVGAYPVESLQWLRRICTEAETHLDHLDFQLKLLKAHPKPVLISESIASSTVKCAREVDASCIIVSTEGGGMARLIAKYRPSIPIVAGCGDDRVAGQLAVSFGIIPVVIKCNFEKENENENNYNSIKINHTCHIDPSQVVYESLKHATSLGLIETGNRIVVASGQVDGFLDGSSTFMQVFTVVGENCYL